MRIEETYEQLLRDASGIDHLRRRNVPDDLILDLMRIQEHMMRQRAGFAVPLRIVFLSTVNKVGARFDLHQHTARAFDAVPGTPDEGKDLTDSLRRLVRRILVDLSVNSTEDLQTMNPPEALAAFLASMPAAHCAP